ncbi:MAG: hypothetical protein ACHQX1_03240 [Candidatus Micrarchaeales archaeon]
MAEPKTVSSNTSVPANAKRLAPLERTEAQLAMDREMARITFDVIFKCIREGQVEVPIKAKM